MQLKATYKIFKIKTCCVVSDWRGEKCSTHTLCRGAVHLQSRKCWARTKFLTNRQTKSAVAWLMNAARLVSSSFLQQKMFHIRAGGQLPPNKLKIMFEFIELLIAYVAVAKSGLSDRRWISTPVLLNAKNYSAAMKRRTSQQRERWSPRLIRFQSLFSARTKDEMRVLWMQLKAKRGKTRRRSFIIVNLRPPVNEGRINGKIESLNVIDFLSSNCILAVVQSKKSVSSN